MSDLVTLREPLDYFWAAFLACCVLAAPFVAAAWGWRKWRNER